MRSKNVQESFLHFSNHLLTWRTGVVAVVVVVVVVLFCCGIILVHAALLITIQSVTVVFDAVFASGENVSVSIRRHGVASLSLEHLIMFLAAIFKQFGGRRGVAIALIFARCRQLHTRLTWGRTYIQLLLR